MPADLRLVAQEPHVTVFVVAWTQWTEARTPYVLAACVNDVLDDRWAEGLERFTLDEMKGDPRLGAALAAWDRGDHSVHRRERQVRDQLLGRWSVARREAMRQHPSMTARAPVAVQ